MRRLIAILAASALLLSSVGLVSAAAPRSTLAKGQRVVTSVSTNVVQGGKAWMTVKMTRCDRTQIKNYVVTASSDLTAATTLQRVGTVNNAGSSSKACVWRSSFIVSKTATLGAHVVTFNVTAAGGISTLANATKTITVRAPEASGGTDHSAGS